MDVLRVLAHESVEGGSLEFIDLRKLALSTAALSTAVRPDEPQAD